MLLPCSAPLRSPTFPALWHVAIAAIVLTADSSHADVPLVAPEAVGLSADVLERIAPLVRREIEAGNLPGCVVTIGRTGGVGYRQAFGNRQLEPTIEPMTVDTVFDMASLTKPIATATSVMLLVQRGQVRLDEPVARYLPEFAAHGKESITIEQLLTHQGGLVPDNPLADYEDGPELAWQRINALQPKVDPGTRFIYTDVGFLVLGEVVRAVSGVDVAQFAKANVFEPLGMHETGYVPDEPLRQRAAPTEKQRGNWLRGTVHDPRAALLGGVAGHAGLFSSANDLAIYCDAMLRGGGNRRAQLLHRLTLREMTIPRNIAGHLRGLGWDMASKYSSNRGELFSPQAFGHGGFTGTAMWIDPTLDLFVIFLSNRLHPDGKGIVNPLAGRIGTIAATAIVGPNHCLAQSPPPTRVRPPTTLAPANQATLTGIDVLEEQGFALLAGKRVGLIVNHTSLDRRGRRTVDRLHEAPNVKLVALFSPEHGLQGTLDQARIDDTRDEATGLPVHSLYGATRQPSPEQLQGLDVLVFDIQDIGARFYTYVSTMGLAMEAAARDGIEFVVLDRPNPLGGGIEGPLLDKQHESFVGFHNVPLRYGMTAGELAGMIRNERGWKVELHVVPVQNWRRDQYWDATGLAWVNPSPNIRSLTQALLYPGVGLLETTNLSVGRGTDAPFECLGAPWIDGRQLAAELNAAGVAGVGFVPIEFTPTATKYTGERCGGVNFTVTDRSKFRPVSMGLEVACALRKLYPHEWKLDGMNRLLINRKVLAAIGAGRTAEAIEAEYAAELRQFNRRAQPFRRYE